MRRLGLVLVLSVLAVAIAAPTAGATPSAACSPQSCGTWQPGPVSIEWTDSAGDPSVCPTSVDTESPDANGTEVDCDDGDGDGTVTIHVKIDKTPPTDVAGALDRPPDQGGWYNHPFSVPFTGTDALSGLNGPCTSPVYAGPDGSGLSVTGSCTDMAGNVTSAASPTFNYDATPPTVTGASADRPPDHDGWYNHPVSFTFNGTDPTSGIAGCTSASYSGPVDASAAVNGACADNAGNVGLGSQPFKYDSVRPAAPQVQITPGNRRVDISWTLPKDADEVTVSRSQQGTSAAPVVVYSGTANSFLDKRLSNGVKYRYAISDSDAAGNTSTNVVRAIPTASSLRPFVGSVVGSPPLLTWRTVKGASYYNVQIFFGKKKVLSIWPRKPSLQLKPRWHFRGKTYNFAPGHYRWYVWPGFGPLSAHRYGHRLGRSSFRAA